LRDGLRLPAGFIQPFDLSFAADDLHVMVYLADHPSYEAIEAMIRVRTDRASQVRAIITRHDQSQVDHSNDPRQLVSSERRERHSSEIDCRVEDLPDCLRVSLRFQSFSRENVMLEITSLGKPDSKRGGLTDPGGHSSDSSLPVMYRGRSTFVSPQTRVTIEGEPFAVPVQIETAGRPIAMKGYVTELHHMAALRAGDMELELVESPRAFEAGERWIYACGDDEIIYDIVAAEAGVIDVVRLDKKRVESIRANVTDDGLGLTELVVRDVDADQHLARLNFKARVFSIAIDDADELVTGTFDVIRGTNSETVMRLLPQEPAWARARPVAVTLRRTACHLSISKSIG
jgi:hypothetical protein